MEMRQVELDPRNQRFLDPYGVVVAGKDSNVQEAIIRRKEQRVPE